MERTSPKTILPPKRILFFAWGYSIHAYRRIKIFADDKRFSVALLSTHPYKIPGVKFYPLTHAINIEKFSGSKPDQGSTTNMPKRSKGIKESIFAIYSFCKKLGTKVHILDDLSAGFFEDALMLKRDIRLAREAIADFSPNLIFLQTLLYPNYVAYFLPKKIPIAVTFWNGDVIWWAKWNGLDKFFKKRIVTYGARRAKIVTVNSETAFRACLNYGVQKDNIHLIRYPGVDLKIFYPRSRSEARSKLGITQENVILWPRGLGAYLNSDKFLTAAFKLLKKHPDTLFIMLSKVGADLIPSYKSQIEAEGFEKNFRWEVQVDHELMPWYHSAANVMVSLSANDSLPNVMLEAMACGVPVIMSDIPQIHEWINDKENGFLVNPNDTEQIVSILEKVLDKKNTQLLDTFIPINIDQVKKLANQEINEKQVKDLILTSS